MVPCKMLGLHSMLAVDIMVSDLRSKLANVLYEDHKTYRDHWHIEGMRYE